jgi:hypothetical protein
MALVYAYGCDQPLSGLEAAMAEVNRCAQMWNALVEIDRDIAQRELDRAIELDQAVAQAHREIQSLTEHLVLVPSDRGARHQRSRTYQVRRRLLIAWRRHNRPWLKLLNAERLSRVVEVRQRFTWRSAEPIYWGNCDRVLSSYDTGRQAARRTGHRLKPFNTDRDDGVLRVQIQRTRTGLGAAPVELTDGGVSDLQWSRPSERGQGILSFRVDAVGNHVQIPVWIHRPLPPGCRVKLAQLTFRRQGARLCWQLCLTIDPTACQPALYAPMRQASVPPGYCGDVESPTNRLTSSVPPGYCGDSTSDSTTLPDQYTYNQRSAWLLRRQSVPYL